jgi:hypothetical protein
MQTIQIPYTEQKPKINWLREIKLATVGFISMWLVEIIFFCITAGSIWLIWIGVQHAMHLPPRQNTYLYSDQEVKYLVVIIGGMKRRIGIKRFCKRYKILCH